MPDLPLHRPGHGPTHLTALASGRFALLTMGEVCDAPADSEPIVMGRDVLDAAGLFGQRFDAGDGAGFLLRPDGHLTARWRQPTTAKVAHAIQRAKGF